MKQRTGYVYEDKGRWYARLTYTDETNKRRNVRRRAENKTHGNEIRKEILRELDEQGSRPIQAARMTVADLCDFYTQHYLTVPEYVGGRQVVGLRSVKTVEDYLTIYRKYFGKRLLRSLTYTDLRTFRLLRLKTPTWRKQQRSIATVNREMAYLRRLFNIAAREGWIPRNPFSAGDSLVNIADERKRERILTRDEETKLLSECTGRRSHLRPIIIAAIDTGCRLGELRKMVWRDIDFEAGLIPSNKAGIYLRPASNFFRYLSSRLAHEEASTEGSN